MLYFNAFFPREIVMFAAVHIELAVFLYTCFALFRDVTNWCNGAQFFVGHILGNRHPNALVTWAQRRV